MLIFIYLIASAVIVQGTLVITSPLVTDFPNNTIPYYYSNFGEVTYGKTLSFDISIMQNGLCDNSKEFKKLTKPTYLVVQTNYHQTCSYTKRAEVAQLMGAKGLIISAPVADYARGNVIESDDGNGKKIHITCLFIGSKSFDTLKGLSKVEIIAKFPVPQAKVSTVNLFISSAKRSSYVFLRQFRNEYNQLKKHINFEPIYHTISCQNCNNDNCFLSSCCYDYQHHQNGVGQKILKEELHQYAIYTQKGVQKWMTYMNLFDEYCDGDWFAIQDCIQVILQKMSMNDVQILNPMDQTLRSWKVKQSHIGFDSFPEIAVNSMVYRGNFQINDIVLTICSSLLSPPSYCQQKFADNVTQPSKHKHVIIILVSVLFALLVVAGLGICCYRNFIKSELTRDMTSKVGEIIANYANNVSSQKKKNLDRLVETFDEEL